MRRCCRAGPVRARRRAPRRCRCRGQADREVGEADQSGRSVTGATAPRVPARWRPGACGCRSRRWPCSGRRRWCRSPMTATCTSRASSTKPRPGASSALAADIGRPSVAYSSASAMRSTRRSEIAPDSVEGMALRRSAVMTKWMPTDAALADQPGQAFEQLAVVDVDERGVEARRSRRAARRRRAAAARGRRRCSPSDDAPPAPSTALRSLHHLLEHHEQPLGALDLVGVDRPPPQWGSVLERPQAAAGEVERVEVQVVGPQPAGERGGEGAQQPWSCPSRWCRRRAGGRCAPRSTDHWRLAPAASGRSTSPSGGASSVGAGSVAARTRSARRASRLGRAAASHGSGWSAMPRSVVAPRRWRSTSRCRSVGRRRRPRRRRPTAAPRGAKPGRERGTRRPGGQRCGAAGGAGAAVRGLHDAARRCGRCDVAAARGSTWGCARRRAGR